MDIPVCVVSVSLQHGNFRIVPEICVNVGDTLLCVPVLLGMCKNKPKTFYVVSNMWKNARNSFHSCTLLQ